MTVCFAACYTGGFTSPGLPFGPTEEDTDYIRAGALVEKLLSGDPDAVRKLRLAQPDMSLIGEREIRAACPWLDEREAHDLASPFGTFAGP